MDWVEVPGSVDIKNIGTRKQLFLDDEIIETHRWVTPRADKSAPLLVETAAETAALHDAEAARGEDVSSGIPGHVLLGTQFIRRTRHTPVKHPDNPILKRDRPWEGCSAANAHLINPSVMHDEEAGIWKMWYGSYGGLEGGSKGSVAPGLENVGCFTMYATSEDGIVWEKPDLGIVDFRGSTKNNIIFFKEGVKYCYLAPPSIKDPHDAEAGRWRYKSTVKTKPEMTVAVSRDGIHWEILDTFERIGDESCGAVYDRDNQVYISITRNLYRRPGYGNQGSGKRNILPYFRTHRTIQMALSKDMVRWSHPRLLLFPDSDDLPDVEFKSLVPFKYEGAWIATLGAHRETHAPTGDDSDNQLAYSRDFLHWRRPCGRKTFMPPGPDGSWEDINNQSFNFIVRDDKIYIYYAGNGWRDPFTCSSIGLATLRLDGFASLEAPVAAKKVNDPPREGTLLTKPLWSKGNRLVINAETNAYVTAELTDPDGRVIPGFGNADCERFTGDSVRHTLSWKGREEIGGLFPLRIRFRMRDARLYSLQVPKG